MDEEIKTELQNKLLDYLSSVENGIESLINFGSDQIPLLVQEIISYAVIEGIIIAVLQLIATALFLFGATKARAAVYEDTSDDGLAIGLALMVCLPAVLFGVSAMYNSLYAIKAYYAPRLFMLEYIKEFIN